MLYSRLVGDAAAMVLPQSSAAYGDAARGDLWELVAGTDAIPPDVPENVESRPKWKIKCGKALFALRTSISKEFIDHVRDVCSPKEVWETLERLFTKKNTARLQLLENELAMLK
ncbi:hypothetical protein RJ639_040239 [Escallonia herrerae]|uniref:Uncharacterized protein n=1 Tax=Escallonia herrerae TaxID=1293975 RepID=A0AA89B309_9ASTE|nr:hypothetical protein RJ639_040239 [Escallonia herrerae]